MQSRQQGFAFLIAVVLLVSVAALATAQLLQVRAGSATQAENLTRSFNRAHETLLGFATELGRLPCPANPTLDTGGEERNVATSTCDYPLGTLPWKALGMRREDAYDTWGWKISYRVYQGSAGTLTQPGGVSMVDCDPTEAEGTDPANGLCKSTQKTIPGQFADAEGTSFLGRKGFTVNDFGTTRTGVAYVLISHGSSGYGGYTSAGTQLTAPTNTNEVANTSAAGDFVATSPSASSVAPDDAAHFDDVITYATIADVISKAGRSARVWP
jgi:type II secretory pathway pseudopilin PulG